MQLGELAANHEHFRKRNVTIVAVSVDDAEDSKPFAERSGMPFALLADPEQSVIEAFRVRNDDTTELSLHAVYIADGRGRIYYRKVARRRPYSGELLDAIDFHHGRWPRPALELADGEATGYHVAVGEAVVDAWRHRTLLVPLSGRSAEVIDGIVAAFGEGEWDVAIQAWKRLHRERERPLSQRRAWARHIAWRAFMQEHTQLRALAQELSGQDEATRRSAALGMIRSLPDDDRGAAFSTRSIISVFDDVSRSRVE